MESNQKEKGSVGTQFQISETRRSWYVVNFLDNQSTGLGTEVTSIAKDLVSWGKLGKQLATRCRE